MKRIFALILALTMMVTAAAFASAETTMPIVEEPITMTMMIGLDTSRGYDPADNAVFKYLEEVTNIHWDFIVVDRSSWTERLSLMWASGDMPDMIYNGVSGNDLLLYTGTLILDLKPYLEEYAPNFWNLYQNNADVRLAVDLPTGKIGSFVWTNMEIEAGAGQCPNEILYINQQWLDALGLEMPQTVDEYYETLVAFRDKDPNGNGEQDEIPLAPRNASTDLSKLQPLMGFMSDTNNLYLDGDTVQYAPLMEEYKQWVEFCAKLYAEGLIDPDIFVMDSAEVLAKGSLNPQVYGSVIASAAFTVVGADNADAYVPTPIYTAANGETMWYNRVYANSGVGVITTACEYPEETIRWCDLFYSDEYVKLVWMGQEGVAYEYNEDGTWDWIYSEEYPDATAVRAALTIQAGGQGPSMCPTDWFKLNDETEAPVNAQRAQIASDYDGLLRVPMPRLYYEESAAREMSTIATDLNTYVNEMVALFVTGEADIESGWADFTATVEAMGASRLVEIAQEAYDAVA